MIKPKILIVEDHAATADAIGYSCETESMIPIVVYNGTDALKTFGEHGDIALVILDINLPDSNGFEICRVMREKRKTPIIIMTARVDEYDELTGLEIGADAYVKKPVKPRIMIAHIRAILRRANDWAEQEKLPTGENGKVHEPHPDFTVNEEARAISFFGILLDLTVFEYLILSNMICHPGRIYSIDQITSMIDEDVVVTENSIYNMISRIRQKLAQIKPDITIIESCRGFGYRVVVPE